MPCKKLIIAETLNFSDEAVDIVSDVIKVEKRDISNDELPWAFREFDYFWFRLGFRITDELLCQPGRKVSVILCPVTGLDHIDVKTCEELNIKIISLKGENEFLKQVRATAELTIGLTLALMRKIPQAINSVKQDVWDRDLFKGKELLDKQIGIIGMGRLGEIVANYFLGFGSKVSAYDVNNFKQKNVTKVKNIKKLVSQSDIITLHVNYNEKNHHLIDSDLFKHFKRGSILINTSRGCLVDSYALIENLKNDRLSGAAVDVIEDEFNHSDNPLVKYATKHDNLLITPHIGGNTTESFVKTELFVAMKFVEYLKLYE